MNDPKKIDDLDQARRAVFLEVDERENDELLRDQVSGYDFNQGINYNEIFQSFRTTGFQAANLSKAIDIINEMVSLLFCSIPNNINNSIASHFRPVKTAPRAF